MCGRFVRSSSLADLAGYFNVDQPSFDIGPSYNVAPTQEIIIINSRGVKQIVKCHWGFVPSWARDLSEGNGLINARAETVADKVSFRAAFRTQRCLVIANGFYEWRKDGKRKVPVYVSLKAGNPFGFAGLYNVWVSPAGEKICTCAIITTEANDLVSAVHDRMPAIIPRGKEDLWLNPLTVDIDALKGLLTSYPPEEMEMRTVSDRVNSPGIDSPDNIKPL